MSGLVDTHCHVMARQFERDRAAVLERAERAGVHALVLVGYDLASSRAAVKLAHSLPNAVATVGIHPNASGDAADSEFDDLAQLASDPSVVGIGETGLDYFRERTPPARQKWAFDWHLRLAEARGLPVIVHTRDAHADIEPLLEASAARRPAGQIPGILHCFSGDRAHAERMVEAGYYPSFAGPLTYKNSALPEVVVAVPRARLLVETDCPYLPPASKRGQRNEPAYMVETAHMLMQLTHVTTAELWSNSVRVFPALARIGQVVA